MPSAEPPPVPRTPTRFELADEIRAAAQGRHADLEETAETVIPPLSLAAITKSSPMLPLMPDISPGADVPGSPVAPAPAPPRRSAVRLFRPSHRPPVPLLCVFDDGADDGEVVRVRGERFVIGRAEGDLVLPHDDLISSRHAEIVRRKIDAGRWVWVLSDLGSANGTFVRAGTAILRDGQEFLVGRTRYRFDAAADSHPPVPKAPGSRATLSWSSSAGLPVPSVVELTPDGPGARLPLGKLEHWIGSDPTACDIVPADDPFVSLRHAKISCDAKGRWHVASNKAPNGVWVRIEQTELRASCYFQIGEQRFSFKVS
jgi:hypothetical protein